MLKNFLNWQQGTEMLDNCTIHGVLLQIFDTGTLITGESGTGKSELALGLVDRGHRLICDDAPQFQIASTQVIIGQCPEILIGKIEVRGLGILDLKKLYGETAIMAKIQLDLIIQLTPADKQRDRSQQLTRKKDVLGISVPEVTLPLSQNRNLPLLTEAIVRTHQLNEDRQ